MSIEKCMAEMDFVPETCKFIKKCPPGTIRNDKGRCVDGTNMNIQLNKIKDEIGLIKEDPRKRGPVKMRLTQMMRRAKVPYHERISKLLEEASALTNKEIEAKREKETRKSVSQAKKAEKEAKEIETKKKKNAVALKKAIEAAKRQSRAAEKKDKPQSLRERKAAAATRKNKKPSRKLRKKLMKMN